jgi:hypothetical protein
MEITKIHKASTGTTSIKYKFGIQVPKGIKNAINLDRKNGNNLWQESIKTELKQLTDYETFIVLDSGEDIPMGYQKIPYHIKFDLKYDLRHKARLVVHSLSVESKKIIPNSLGCKQYQSSITNIEYETNDV